MKPRKEVVAMNELQGIARYKFHEGKVEEYKRLVAQSMEIVRAKDTGTLRYEIYFNNDQSECIVLERYRDSDALVEHLANLGDLGQAMLATGSVSGKLLGEQAVFDAAAEPKRSLWIDTKNHVELCDIEPHVTLGRSRDRLVSRKSQSAGLGARRNKEQP
jgi:quinol monooxygenase YgiN